MAWHRGRGDVCARAAITPVHAVIDEEARLESDHFRVLILPRAGGAT
jgi:hypothetical protein